MVIIDTHNPHHQV